MGRRVLLMVSICTLNKYLLSNFYMADTVLGIWDIAVNKASKDPSLRCLMGQYWWWTGKHMERETNDQDTFRVIKKCFEACSDLKILLMIGWSRWLL